MQNNAIDVITRGVDIYELILQSQRLQNGRQTHIGNTSLFCKDKNWEINKWMANTHWQHNDCYFKGAFFLQHQTMFWINELYSAPKSALSQGSLHKGTTPWCFSILENPELQQQRSCSTRLNSFQLAAGLQFPSSLQKLCSSLFPTVWQNCDLEPFLKE